MPLSPAQYTARTLLTAIFIQPVADISMRLDLLKMHLSGQVTEHTTNGI